MECKLILRDKGERMFLYCWFEAVQFHKDRNES